MLGQSLYGFGVHGLAHAVASTRNGSVPYVLGRQDERLTDQRAFIEMGEQAYALYKEIEPIALAKEAIAWRWLKWEGVAQGPHYEGTLRDSVAPDHST